MLVTHRLARVGGWPSLARDKKGRRKMTDEEMQEVVRWEIVTTRELRTRVKIQAASEGVTIQEWINALIRDNTRPLPERQ